MGKELKTNLTSFATFDYPRQHCRPLKQCYVDLVMLMIAKNVYLIEISGGWSILYIEGSQVLFVLLLYVPSQQLWSLRDGQFT